MASTARASIFLPVVEAHRATLASLVVPGFLIRTDYQDQRPCRTPYPLPEAACPDCNDSLSARAQFWARGRLWRFQFCPVCICGVLDSAGTEHGLVPGQDVEGNSAWALTAARFLAPVDGALWKANPAVQELVGALREGEDWDDFLAALRLAFGTTPPTFDALNRLGGVEDPIQFPNEPDCTVCGEPMTFLAQLGEQAGFSWGDAGAASLFACLTHLGCTRVVCDTH